MAIKNVYQSVADLAKRIQQICSLDILQFSTKQK